MQVRRISLRACVAATTAVVISTLAFSDNGENEAPSPVRAQHVQPDYGKWKLVKVGMSESVVIDLLGKPIEEIDRPSDSPTYSTKFSRFGRISFNSPSMPVPFDFEIQFKGGKVVAIYDPFRGKFSDDGKPTTPTLIYPSDRTKFDHYPRFVDLRWNPSSGKYPIEYQIEVDSGQFAGGAILSYHEFERLRSEMPYSVFAFVGQNPGRWRVKAKNELGESDWSEWRTFRFEH